MRARQFAIRVAAAVVLLASAGTVPAHANGPDQPAAVDGQLAWVNQGPDWTTDERRKLSYFSSLIISNKLDELEQLLEEYPLRGRFAERRTQFFRAAILRRRGKLKEAVEIYRGILAQNPELEKVRAELAATLYEMEDDDGARHHLNRLLSSNANDPSRKIFKNLLDHIDQRRPWQFGAYATLAPSTNYKKGSRHDTIALGPFNLNIDNQEESGLGLRGGAYGSYTFRIDEEHAVIAAGSVAHSEYPGDNFDDTQLTGNVEFRKTFGPAYYGIALTASRRWLGGEGQSVSVGPRVTLKAPVSSNVSFRSTIAHQEKRYDDADYLDGHEISVSTRATVGLGADKAVFLLAGGSRNQTKLDHNDYWSHYMGIGFYKEWPLGITTFAEARVSHYIYDGIYPNKVAPRKDSRLNFVASLTKRDWNFMGFAPKVEYTLSHGLSNVEFYDFTEHGMNLTVTRDF
ncbi:MAG: porin family protein [Pseudomonadota bacterium]